MQRYGMGTLYIYVDSSTKGANGTKYGESIAAWMFRWKNASTLYRGRVHYFHKFGRNKTFYEGVIRALESAVTEVSKDLPDRIKVYGDCQTVINQLKGKWNAGQLEPYHKRVRAAERRVGEMWPTTLGETDSTYKKVDQLSKLGRGLFQRAMK